MRSGGTANRFWFSTMKSADLPGAIEPVVAPRPIAVALARRAVALAHVLDGVERQPQRGVAGGVQLDGDAAPVQRRQLIGQLRAGEVAFAVEMGAVLLVGQVGIEEGGGARRRHAVEE